ncbi:hypothetical protein Ocin01_08144 [Orchesella cincta]|uniref:Uncharacterized protein n=1 Tax=Orchesella cincta TaxID=48709 RepID=A0A1D2N0U9_ORCCI|nr:hypothetical protein Ocin01_08144 [Orchesella cincta]
MVPNPCCCWTLPNGAKATAVFELVMGLVNLPFTITSLILGIIRAVAGGVLGLGTWGENVKLCWIWIGLATLGSVIYLILMTFLLPVSERSVKFQLKNRDKMIRPGEIKSRGGCEQPRSFISNVYVRMSVLPGKWNLGDRNSGELSTTSIPTVDYCNGFEDH